MIVFPNLLVFQMVSDRVESSHQFYLLFIWMVCWKSYQTLMVLVVIGVTCLQEHSAMQMILLSWLHVRLLLDGCWIFAVYMLMIMVCCSMLVKLSLFVFVLEKTVAFYH